MDDMRAGAKVTKAPIHEINGHVTAVAAVWPKLPAGSDCDRKPDRHGGYFVADADEAIATIAKSALKPAWSLDKWRQFIGICPAECPSSDVCVRRIASQRVVDQHALRHRQ